MNYRLSILYARYKYAHRIEKSQATIILYGSNEVSKIILYIDDYHLDGKLLVDILSSAIVNTWDCKNNVLTHLSSFLKIFLFVLYCFKSKQCKFSGAQSLLHLKIVCALLWTEWKGH